MMTPPAPLKIPGSEGMILAFRRGLSSPCTIRYTNTALQIDDLHSSPISPYEGGASVRILSDAFAARQGAGAIHGPPGSEPVTAFHPLLSRSHSRPLSQVKIRDARMGFRGFEQGDAACAPDTRIPEQQVIQKMQIPDVMQAVPVNTVSFGECRYDN